MTELSYKEMENNKTNEYEPSSFSEFIGQSRIKRELLAMLATKDSSNLLIRGNYGGGKTTIAMIYAAMRGLYTYAKTPKSFIGVRNLDASSHIIDEIHLEDNFERLYTDMKKYTMIFCTTEREKIPAPFLSRCVELVLEDYTIPQLEEIITRKAVNDQISIYYGVQEVIAQRCKYTPRIALQMLKRLNNMSVYEGESLTPQYAIKTFDSLHIFDNGLNEEDIKYLMALRNGNVISLNSLGAAINRSVESIKESLEPFLIYKGYIEVTPRGRLVTSAGKEILYSLLEKGVIGVNT